MENELLLTPEKYSELLEAALELRMVLRREEFERWLDIIYSPEFMVVPDDKASSPQPLEDYIKIRCVGDLTDQEIVDKILAPGYLDAMDESKRGSFEDLMKTLGENKNREQ